MPEENLNQGLDNNVDTGESGEESLISVDEVKELGESLTSDEAKALLKSAIEVAEKKVKEGGQVRFNEITREKYDAIRKVEALEEENKLYKAKLLEVEKRGVEAKKDEVKDEKPKLEDYDDVATHTEALIEFNRKQDREYYDAKIKKIETDGAKSAEEVRLQEIHEELARGKKDYSDFDKVARNPKLPYNDILRDIVLNLKDARHIEYYLGAHIDEIDRLSRLPEREALIEIGAIRAKLTKPKDKKTGEEQISEVAEVINPVEGNEIVTKDVSKMSTDELRVHFKW